MRRLIAWFRSLQFSSRSTPLALLALCLLAFGLLVPWLGFYWDDWPTIWYLHTYGAASFKDVFAVDRPLLAWLFSLTTRLVGESTVGWQLFGILTRWGASLSLWGMLRALWPGRERFTAWVALVFAVYPGFRQQYISVTYSHDWIVLALFFLSYTLMIQALRQPRRFWLLMATSWLISFYCLFADEYYFGLELLRPVVLWMVYHPGQPLVLRQDSWQRSRRLLQSLLLALPYGLIGAAFLYWRLFIFVSPRGQVQIAGGAEQDVLTSVVQLGRTALGDILEAGFLAWGDAVRLPYWFSQGRLTGAIALAAALSTLVLAIIYLWKLRPDGEAPVTRLLRWLPGEAWGWQAVLLGLLALSVAGIPFWATALPITLDFPWDRFMLAMMFGASLLLTGIIALVPPRPVQTTLLALILAAAVGFHFFNGTTYRREWAAQRDFFWQLSWRIPGLQPGTTILTADLPFTYFSDNSLTAPLNWLYAPDLASRQLPYVLYNIESRQTRKLLDLKPGAPVEIPYRMASFSGTLDQALAVFYSPPGCVKVANPQADKALPQKLRYFADALPFSNLSTIDLQAQAPARPPQAILGSEPERGWCYYFEMSDLARQQQDWPLAAEMADRALGLDVIIYEVNAPELVTFLEAYAHTAQWKKAARVTDQALQASFRMDSMLCAAWRRVLAATPESETREAARMEAAELLKCNLP